MKRRFLFLSIVLIALTLVMNPFQVVHAAPLLQGSPDLTLLDIVSDPPNPAPWDSLHYMAQLRFVG